jgi:hypothetical protein
VREYEEQKQKGTYKGGLAIGQSLIEREKLMEPDEELDEFWLVIRNYFNDLTEKLDKREIAKGEDGNRTKFLKACEAKDFMDNGNISVQQLIEVFAAIKFKPLPSETILRKLCKACEAFTTGERPYV